MRVIQFLEPVHNDFVGPFSTLESAQRWLEENNRTERHAIHHIVDPAEEMFGVDLEDRLVNEAPDARNKPGHFIPNIELYGKEIRIIEGSSDQSESMSIIGTLKKITGPHSYTITVEGFDQGWEVDSVNDLIVEENGDLTLWNAWRTDA